MVSFVNTQYHKNKHHHTFFLQTKIKIQGGRSPGTKGLGGRGRGPRTKGVGRRGGGGRGRGPGTMGLGGEAGGSWDQGADIISQ